MRVTAAMIVVLMSMTLIPVMVLAGGPYLDRSPRDSAAFNAPADACWSVGPRQENTRLVSSGLALLLGPFGAHRLYLGTTPKVAVIYGVTFGGFGLLAVIDLGHLLFSKDLEPYRHNDRVFMWGGRGATPTPP